MIILIKIFRYLNKKQWIQILLSLVFIVTQVFLDLKIPDYMSKITMYVESPGHTVSDIVGEGKWMLLCAFGSLLSAIIVGYLASKISASFSKNLRSRIFSKVESFSMKEINEFSTASLITRSTNDITQIQMVIVIGLQILIKAPIMAVWAITKIYNKGFEWTMATAVTVLVLIVFVAILMVMVMPKFRMMQTLTDNINRILRENLTGLAVIRAYNSEDYREGKFDEANIDLTRTQLFTSRAMSMLFPMINFSMSMLTLVIYFIGAGLINAAQMMDKYVLFSNMVVFSSYAMQVIMSFMMMSMIFIMVPRAEISAKRINEVLDTELSIKDGNLDSSNEDYEYEIEFDDVSFKYTDSEQYILQNIDFKVKKGEKVAIIGSTGSGKSTILNLLLRFYDATEGVVKIQGVDIKQYKLKFLYEKIAAVLQKSFLFKGDIKSNISFGDEDTDTKMVEEAADTSQSIEFIDKFDDKYDHEIAQLGKNVSGGQKQRLSIARAIYRKPDIFLFDDSFSALDFKTDSELRHQLKENNPDSTTIVVAQRVGSIMDSDQIIVLENGQIVGIGKHKDLLKNCEVYKEIAYSQLTEEELNA
ncbi:ABC transporter ATP-binding protein [Finegoldia magna]|uniref:Multidrug ABC transporter n=1 Tax=Finegoldia magna (strain ATCC 29328 / DSM 20472 / WAL 2508) TaxID=334413 RepID=B0S3A4_FINM2|nr:ABC transporter ATP-binding protein [Finegoldia magna]UEA69812.1 ABC transporter ATP-binding protein/permease [Finegoldia magna]BAG08844.1 multidrug ABC transporter [Finegoldia magna ATCC 29328]